MLGVSIGRPTRRRPNLAVLAVTLAAASVAMPLPAAPAPVPPSAAHGTVVATTAAPAPTPAELDDFARAIIATGNIKRAARPGIEGATTAANRARLEQAATRRIKAAIRSDHLSVRRYLEIVAFVQAHPAAQAQVLGLLKQLPLPPPPPYQPLNR